jgi:hypothetical protein
VVGRIRQAAARLDAKAAQAHAGVVQGLLDRVERLFPPEVEFDPGHPGLVRSADARRQVVIPFCEHPFDTCCELHIGLSKNCH